MLPNMLSNVTGNNDDYFDSLIQRVWEHIEQSLDGAGTIHKDIGTYRAIHKWCWDNP